MTFDDHLAQAPEEARYEYFWDQWGIHEERNESSTDWSDIFYALGNSSNLAVSCALSEWLLSGLKEADINGIAADFIPAAWACFSRDWSLAYTELAEKRWQGPRAQMLNMTVTILNDAIFCRDEMEEVAYRTDWLMLYAIKVYGHSDLFGDWIGDVTRRMVEIDIVGTDRLVEADFSWTQPVVSRRFFDRGGAMPGSTIEVQGEVDAWITSIAMDNRFLQLA